MASWRPTRRGLLVERLESRLVLSLSFGADSIELAAGELAAETARAGASPVAPQIRVDLVALHEFGHSLGLQHSSDPTSIMYAYYNANYDKTNFLADSSVTVLRSLYANVDAGPWKNRLDQNPTNGRVDVSYSFVPDGTAMDKGTSSLFATFNATFGQGQWQPVFSTELNRWSSVSGPTSSDPHISFFEHADAGLAFNYSGLAQNDPNSGDLRIAAHRFDGAGKTLAHAYFPPPNGATAAGDAHFDKSENWVISGGSLFAPSATQSSQQTSVGDLTAADAEIDANELVASILCQPAQQARGGIAPQGLVVAEAVPGAAGSATSGGAGDNVTSLVAINPQRVSLPRWSAKAWDTKDLFFDEYEPSDLASALPELLGEFAG